MNDVGSEGPLPTSNEVKSGNPTFRVEEKDLSKGEKLKEDVNSHSDRMPQAAADLMAHAENREGGVPLSTPRISEFPLKVQPLLIEAYGKVKAGAERVGELVEITQQVAATYEIKTEDVKKIEAEAKGPLTADQRAKVD